MASEFVRVSYVATSEGVAVFEAEDAPLVLGEGLLFPQLEKEITAMKDGEERSIHLLPEEAFGKRSQDLVKLLPSSTFKKNGLDPRAGMVVSIENITGKIQSVSGGRVRVDFNHQLADRPLDIKVKLLCHVAEEADRVRVLFEYNFTRDLAKQLEVSHDGEGLKIKPPKPAVDLADYQARKTNLLRSLKKTLGITKVSFDESAAAG